MRNIKLLWAVIGGLSLAVVVLVCFVIFGFTGAASGNGTVVAEIGKTKIRKGDLEQNLITHYGSSVLNQMLDREAIKMEAQSAGLQISDADIDKELKVMMQAYESEEVFYQSMKEQLGMSRQEVKDDVYYKLLLEKVATKDIQVSDSEIQDYIQAHPEEYAKKREMHLRRVTTKTREQANKVVAAFSKGDDFAKLARDRSIDDYANNGGDLGWVKEDDPLTDKQVMKQAKDLKVGQISKPVQTNEGYLIVFLQESKDKGGLDEQTIKETVRKQLALQKAPSIKDLSKKLREKWNVKIVDPTYQT
ncbi:peptidyl-prolyl cis-trans isomerase [Paenibacillus larvae]